MFSLLGDAGRGKLLGGKIANFKGKSVYIFRPFSRGQEGWSLAKAIKRVSEDLTVGEDVVEIQAMEERLDEAFQNFTEVWECHKKFA